MELLYVWIEDFKNIKRQGFNLSPKHWFEFNPTEKDGQVNGGTLTHETRNPDYPHNFFGENISNITAIVGKNGSGKSSLMEALLKFSLGNSFGHGFNIIGGDLPIVNYQRGFYSGVFTFLKEDGSIYCFQNIFEGVISMCGNSEIKQDSKETYPFKNTLYTKERSFEQVNFFKECCGIDLAYYSNIFREELIIAEKQDSEEITYSNGGTIVHQNNYRYDISLNAKLAPRSTDTIGQKFGVMNLFYWEEIKRLVYFIAEFGKNWFNQTDNIKISLPTFFNIEDRWQSKPRELDVNIRKDYEIHEFLISNLNDTKLLFLYNHTKQLLFIWFRWLETYRFDNNNKNQKKVFLKVKNILHESIKDIDGNNEDPYVLSDKIKKGFNRFSKKIQAEIPAFNAYLPSFYPSSNDFLRKSELFIDSQLTHLNSKTTTKNLEKDFNWVIDFIDTYAEVDFLDLFTFSFSFKEELVYPVFSSGEKYFLSMFSRLNELRKDLDRNNSSKHLLLLLDEAELTLHPEWQRNFLHETINACGQIFKDYKLQFLFSSHSPFLVSDFPKNNIIFLDKDEHGNCIVRNPADITQTFGANIHSLYRSSFFLENGFVGEFAKQKIDWVIRILNGNNKGEIEIHKAKINFIIENIGEPLLRNKLREMYNGNKTIEERIQALEEEIIQLKSSI